jgi:hypothetical protein
MKINQDQLMIAFCNYYENEILNKAPTGLEKFKMGFIYGNIKAKLPKLINQYRDNQLFIMLGIFDSDGFVDIDEMLQYAKESFKKSGKVKVANLVFNEDDLDIMYNYLKGV